MLARKVHGSDEIAVTVDNGITTLLPGFSRSCFDRPRWVSEPCLPIDSALRLRASQTFFGKVNRRSFANIS